MGLYNDLNEVLTPYANKIKELNGSLGTLKADLGDLSQLQTEAKTDIVSAINEAAQTGGGTGGKSVPTEVRNAIYTLLSKAVYAETGLTDEIDVVQSWAREVTEITLDKTSISISGLGTNQLTATTVPAGGEVAWTSSDPEVATVSSNGLVTSVSNGTATIEAVSGSVSARCTVVVSGIVVPTGISAVYAQDGFVYPTDSLDSLKQNLTVTAHYDNGTSEPVTAYTLSGTLSVGTSTITVTYKGKTATFDVVVSKAPTGLLYSWDFTQSLTDSISGKIATTNATRDSNGVTFDVFCQYVDFGVTFGRNMTCEIDVDYIGSKQNESIPYRRLFAFGTNGTETNQQTAALVFGRSSGLWHLYTGSQWDERANYGIGYSAFDGKTVKIYVMPDGKVSLSTKNIGASDDTYVLVSTSTKATLDFTDAKVYMGGTNSDTLANARIKGFRVYQGEK